MQLQISDRHLKIELSFWEKLWALQFNYAFEIPWEHIESVITEKPSTSGLSIRLPGTFVPGVIKAGTYYNKQEREFWYVTQNQNYLTLKLTNEFYTRVVLSIENPEHWAALIKQHQPEADLER